MADTNSLNKPKNSQSCRIVMLGASYAASWSIKKISGCQIINVGIPGDQTHHMLARFEKDVIRHKPDFVLVWGFINDITGSDEVELSITKKNIKTNLIEILRRIESIDALPIVATEITLGYPPGLISTIARWKNKLLNRTSYQELINGHVMDLNHWLIDYSEKHFIPILHLHKILSDEDGFRLPDYLKDDGSHVTAEGYIALDLYIQSIQLLPPR